MFDKLIQIIILNFLNKNKILKTCQFVFRESTSTCDALLDFTDYLQKKIIINIARQSLLILKRHLIH